MKNIFAFIVLALGVLLSGGAIARAACPAALPCPASAPCTGFYTAGNQLVDPSGTAFHIEGFSRVHWDSYGTAVDAKRMGANTVRVAFNFTKPEAANLAIANSYVAQGIVPMPGNWTGTCKADPAVLAAIVDTWVAQAATWTQLNSTGLINIANEWGPANDPAGWRDAYLAAIPRMRAAGYTGTLVIDAGGCGQAAAGIVLHGKTLLDADPEHNLLFDVHVYGSFHYPATATWMQDYTKAIAGLKATGLPIVFGEFGPGRNIGPSPTMVTPQQVIQTAEDNGFGWLAWASDDVNLQGCAANDAWFSMTFKCGVYTGLTTELTTFGNVIVPILQATAKPAGLH